jgi:hypothetical protein
MRDNGRGERRDSLARESLDDLDGRALTPAMLARRAAPVGEDENVIGFAELAKRF